MNNNNDNHASRTNAVTARTNAEEKGLLHGALSGIILGCFFRVYDRLGFGFLESVYRNALAKEFTKAGLSFEREVVIDVWYDGDKIGLFKADFLIEKKIIVEVKASQAVVEADRKQLLNYLRASDVELGLLLHFGPKAFFQRMIHSNSHKSPLR